MANTESHLLINELEENARNNIIKLDQKLKGLKAEVEAKLQSLTLLQEEQDSQGLNTLLAEIDMAINGMKTLVELVVVDDAVLESPEIKQLNKMVAANLKKIIKIKDGF